MYMVTPVQIHLHSCYSGSLPLCDPSVRSSFSCLCRLSCCLPACLPTPLARLSLSVKTFVLVWGFRFGHHNTPPSDSAWLDMRGTLWQLLVPALTVAPEGTALMVCGQIASTALGAPKLTPFHHPCAHLVPLVATVPVVHK